MTSQHSLSHGDSSKPDARIYLLFNLFIGSTVLLLCKIYPYADSIEHHLDVLSLLAGCPPSLLVYIPIWFYRCSFVHPGEHPRIVMSFLLCNKRPPSLQQPLKLPWSVLTSHPTNMDLIGKLCNRSGKRRKKSFLNV